MEQNEKIEARRYILETLDAELKARLLNPHSKPDDIKLAQQGVHYFQEILALEI